MPSQVLTRYRQQATLFEKAPSEIGEVMDLAHIEAMRWKQIERTIYEQGDPTALLGYAGMELTPSIVNQALVTFGAAELLLWPAAGNTPIPPNPQLPKLYRLFAHGTSTTAAAPGTFTLNARMGTLITSTTLSGATGAITPVASATAAHWHLQGYVFLRGSTGATTTIATGSFVLMMSATVGGGGPDSTSNATFGGVSAAFDTTVTSGLVFGRIETTSTTNTATPQFIGWGSWS